MNFYTYYFYTYYFYILLFGYKTQMKKLRPKKYNSFASRKRFIDPDNLLMICGAMN